MIAPMPSGQERCVWWCSLLAACASPGLPPGFCTALANAPETTPARLWLQGDAITAAAVAVAISGLPPAVRTTADAIAPGGELVFAGRDWGPAVTGFRVEKRYRDGGREEFRSVLAAEDGSVLQRSHSVPLADVPLAVLAAARASGRDVRRCEIVADSAVEVGWRATVVDGGGRTFVVELDLAGEVRSRLRVVGAQLATPAR